MLIDPVTTIAQIINFLILVALLKRFLYKPILRVMEQREQKIADRLETARVKMEEAEAEKELYLQKQQQLQAQKQEWLMVMREEVEQERQKLSQQGQQEVQQARNQWYDFLQQEKQQFFQDLRHRITQQVILVTRRVLKDLANSSLEEQIVATFIHRLDELDSSQLQTIRSRAMANPQPKIKIATTFSLNQLQRDRLINAIKAKIAEEAEVSFETVDDFICGIELRDYGYKLSWNLENYLGEMTTELELNLVNQSQN